MKDFFKKLHNRNILVLLFIWGLYILNLLLYFIYGWFSILYSPLETFGLIVISIFGIKKRESSFTMYFIVTCLYLYLFILIDNHPLLINYIFVWIILLICSIYRSYKVILLASAYSFIFTIYSFYKYRSEIFSFLPSSYFVYFALYGISITLFLLSYTKYVETLLSKARSNSKNLNAILGSVDIFTWTWDKNSSKIIFSTDSINIFQIPKEIDCTNVDAIKHAIYAKDLQVVENAISRLHLGESQKIEYRVIDINGDLRWLQNRIMPINDKNGNLIRVDGVLIDITDRKSAEEKVKFLAYHDNLTGLPNRHLLNKYLSQAILNAKQNNTKFALLFIDMDNLKKINDNFGHDIGDIAIREFSRRLLNVIECTNNLCRIGGDEFIVLLENIQDDKVCESVKQIHNSLKEPLKVNRFTLAVTASIGTSIFPKDGTTIKALIKSADNNMYSFKSQKS